MRTWRGILVVVVLVVLATIGGRATVSDAQQSKTDAERIADLEQQVYQLGNRVSVLENDATRNTLPPAAPSSEVYNDGAWLPIPEQYLFPIYCTIKESGSGLYAEQRYELMCLRVDGSK